jgi:hypothetical protein
MDSQIVQQGWLTKQGRIVKNWKRRYFVLSNDKLVYYADAERKQIKGFLNLFQSTICHFKDRQHLFCVITQNRELKKYKRVARKARRSGSKSLMRW